MLAGHYAPALALKRAAPEVPLWALFLAVQVVDIAFFVLAPLGIERLRLLPDGSGLLVISLDSMPYTHSLFSVAIYAAGCSVGGRVLGRPREGAILGAAVASHWLCDWLVHVPDLQLSPGLDVRVGLGLWQLPQLAYVLEVGLVVAAYAWLRPRLEPGRRRRYADLLCFALIAVQTLYAFVLPPPPSLLTLALSAQLFFVSMLGLAAAVDLARWERRVRRQRNL